MFYTIIRYLNKTSGAKSINPSNLDYRIEEDSYVSARAI